MSRTSSSIVEDALVTEMCCGAACDRDKRDAQLKLLGVREFVRLYKAKVVLSDAQKSCIDCIESEYNMSLHPLKE